jgi:hypothetical protein
MRADVLHHSNILLFPRIKQNSTLIGTLISSWNSSRNTPEGVVLFVPNAPQHTLTAI